MAAGSFVGVVWDNSSVMPESQATSRRDFRSERRPSSAWTVESGARTTAWGDIRCAIGGAYLPILVGSILFGVIIGVALFFALTLSAFR